MGLHPCSTSQCWLSIPMWNLNLQLRCIVIQKWRQQRPRICSVRSLCVASVALALIFMPGLYSTVMRLSLSLFLLFVFFYLFLSITTMSFAGYFLVHSLLSDFPAYLRMFFRFDFFWFRLSCDHGWIRWTLTIFVFLHMIHYYCNPELLSYILFVPQLPSLERWALLPFWGFPTLTCFLFFWTCYFLGTCFIFFSQVLGLCLGLFYFIVIFLYLILGYRLRRKFVSIRLSTTVIRNSKFNVHLY